MTTAMRLSLAGLLVASPMLAQSPQRGANSIEGVWKVAERVVTGANPSTVTNPSALYIFTRGYYSIQRVNANSRTSLPAAKDPAHITDAEKIAGFDHWDLFTANSGTYTVQGPMMTIHPLVAKNHSVQEVDQSWEVKVEGNTALFTTRSAPGRPVSETRTKLVRVE